VAAGSGRSFVDEPGGDPKHAHLHLDVPSDTLIPTTDPVGPRLHSDTVFVGWADVLRFADALADLPGRHTGEATLTGGTALLAGAGATITVRLREGLLRVETAFAVGHRVELEVRCRTRWDAESTGQCVARAEQVRAAVLATRPPAG
jgi:hypothetical protein